MLPFPKLPTTHPAPYPGPIKTPNSACRGERWLDIEKRQLELRDG